MADTGRIRNSEWQHDEELKSDLEKYVERNLSRKEILDFVACDYPQYAWSFGTLVSRLAFFNVKYVRYDTSIVDVEDAVREEVEGPGRLLGHHAMHRKIREQHHLCVPRNLVYDVMTLVDPEGLERRGNVSMKKRRRGATGTFTSMVKIVLVY